jgi:hypothetical protein
LALMAECFLKHGVPTSSSADRYQVVVHVDAATLKDRSDGRCEIEHGSALSVETVRRLASDASLTRLDENADGEVLNVGRKTRAPRRAMGRRWGDQALEPRDAVPRASPHGAHRRDRHHHHTPYTAAGVS